jgi:hypothetical protein
MGWVFAQPSLTALEVSWNWIFALPFLAVALHQSQQILATMPPEAAGLANLDPQNPWLAATQLHLAFALYQPLLLAVLHWLLPLAALTWAVISGLGRSLILCRMEPGLRFRPQAMMALQACWMALLALTIWGWLRSIAWVSATHILPGTEPDLIGLSGWTIFLSLGFFTLWALVSWVFSIAPLLMLLEERSVLSALVQSFSLGKTFTGKLIEINLVMGIVKLALIVLAMVFSAAPLPFNDELGPDAMHFIWAMSVVFFFVASDYFQVVRLKSFVEFCRTFRGPRG